MKISSRKFKISSLVVMLLFLLACSKQTDQNNPSPPPLVTNYSFLFGWWNIVQIIDTTGVGHIGDKLYFDSDNFHFQGYGGLGSRTGTWATRPNDSLRIDLTAGWGAPVVGQVSIKRLVSDTLIIQLGTVTAIYKKLDSLPITTPPISTVAGTGVNGYSGDGGLAIQAKIGDGTLSLDANQNIYLLDGNRVRKISSTTGIITTIAGTGINGYSGDGGLAINAALGKGSIVVDASGNIFLSDIAKNCIRKINVLDGKISRVAGTPSPSGGFSGDGGPAINALLYYPWSLKLDASGNLIFADVMNRRVRKINLNTGVISTIAGTGTFGSTGDGGPALQAQLKMNCIALDNNGNVLIVEGNSNKLRKVVVATGIINTIAGNGTKGYNGEAVPALNTMFDGLISAAVDAAGNIYTAEYGNDRVRKLAAADGKFYTVAGTGYGNYTGEGIHASAFAVYFPDFLNVDSQGKLYFMDRYNYRLRKIETN